MAYVPVIGRLSWREYVALIFGFLFIGFESLIRAIIHILPKPVIGWFYRRSRHIFHILFYRSRRQPKTEEQLLSERILRARDFGDLCQIFGYDHEEHVVLTKDGYLLGLHRIAAPKGEPIRRIGTTTGKPVIYLHHGLLMNSEVWICLDSENRSLPFVLASNGYDVWMGNNRGNKYSKKSIHSGPNSSKFWDFSIDEFAWHDIPDSIEYILETTKESSIGYIGFSQGTAQAFAALSIHPKLNDKVKVFIGLAPALSPTGLAAPLVDGLMKASPILIFLFFGRKSILSSVVMWQSILYPPIFTSIIDNFLRFLFDWDSHNITYWQRIAAYGHLYSFASVKAVVHWFQIMRNSAFQMYDDSVIWPITASSTPGYRPVRFPTKNITTPIVLLWGDEDSLVDIETMRRQLPEHIREVKLSGYEHLDLLWGKDVDKDVIPTVLETLEEFVGGASTAGEAASPQYKVLMTCE